MIEVPAIVQEKARVEGAAPWIDAVPTLVEELAAAWGLHIGRVLEGGTESLVVETSDENGVESVLKLLVPRRNCAADEARALELADGRGAARLFRFDPERHALLVERLGPSLVDLGFPAAERHEILARTAAAFWTPIEPGLMRSGAEKAKWLADSIERGWPELGRPCGRRAVDLALRAAESRAAAHRDDHAVMVHGDAHQWNTLQRGDEFALIDPDGVFAEPAYDLGIIMREDPVELMHNDPHDRSRRLAALTGLDEVAIWEWGVVERVATGLAARSIGLEPVATQMLSAADQIAES